MRATYSREYGTKHESKSIGAPHRQTFTSEATPDLPSPVYLANELVLGLKMGAGQQPQLQVRSMLADLGGLGILGGRFLEHTTIAVLMSLMCMKANLLKMT